MRSAGNGMIGAPVSLSAAEIVQVSELVHHLTGMIVGETKRYFIERRIGHRMAATGHLTVARYLAFVAKEVSEQQQLINAFTVNETYFYREDYHLAALGSTILPAIVADRSPGDLVRIWSMPCATGEEAYSIALWLLENWAMVDAYNIEIVGSDIDTDALEAARAGEFGSRSLERLPQQVLDRFFEQERGSKRKIIDDLRESVHFVHANVIDAGSLAGLGTFDVILCRNLLIYFDEAARAVAAENLYRSLAMGGYLCLGHSESMTRTSQRFELHRLPQASVYRKR